MNILLLTIDSLRKDHLSIYGYSRETAPTIKSISEESFVFENCFSNSVFTPGSFPSIFASIYPLDYGEYSPLPKEAIPFYKILNQSGYKTYGIHSNVWLNEYHKYGDGFDELVDMESKSKEKIIIIRNAVNKIVPEKLAKTYNKIGKGFRDFIFKKILGRKRLPYTPAEKVTEKIINKIDQSKDNDFVIWAHFMDLHMPRKFIGEPFCSVSKKEYDKVLLKEAEDLNDSDLQIIKDGFDDNMYHVDKYIKKIVERLKELGIYEKTMIIITADHGEEFNEHGQLGHLNFPYNELVRVPLIIKNGKKEIISKMCSLVDIPYTILNMLGKDIPSNYRGVDLFGDVEKEIFCEYQRDKDKKLATASSKCSNYEEIYCVIKKPWKLVYNKDDGMKMLLRLEDDSVVDDENVKSELFRLFEGKDIIRDVKKDKSSSSEDEEKIKERLKNLGYI